MRTPTHWTGVLVAGLTTALVVSGLTASPAAAAVETVEFRASAASAANVATQRVTVPADVEAGDALLLFSSTGSLPAVTAPPEGWTLEGTQQSNTDTRTILYSKVATATDAGRGLAVGYAATSKGTLTLLAYSGTDPEDPVALATSAPETTSRVTHTTPAVAVATDGSMVVSYWADKSSSTTGWTLPAGQTERSRAVATGPGRVTTVASDPGAPSSAGPTSPVTATVTPGPGSGKATMWSVVLEPAESEAEVNVAPVAGFSATCEQLTCTVDGSASTDADGTVSSWAWDMAGVGATGSTTSHTFDTAGVKTISLVVTDDDGQPSARVQQQVEVTDEAPEPLDEIVHRASAESAETVATQRVSVPAGVRAGDTLLLFSTTASLPALTTPPEGWTLEGTRQSSTDTRTMLWSKVATATDAGRSQAVAYAAVSKGTLTLLAYSGTAADAVAGVVSAGETTNRTTHTAPAATVQTSGSTVVSYWADKSSSTTGWTLPAGQDRRTLTLGTGPGRITSVASDQTAAAGPLAGRTATVTGTGSGKATMWTVVLRPAVAGPPNALPVARFTASCPQLTCTVDASTSSDPDGTLTSYSWDFGNGATATGVTANHTYAAAGPRTIRLTVTDNREGTASAERVVTVTAPLPSPLGHTRLVPDKPRANTPRISTGEIWDIEVVGQRVFVAGGFTSLQNTTGNTATVSQAYLAAYDINTGLIDTTFRPTFGGGGVNAVEASPDGTKLFVAGTFNTVGGLARQKVASLDLTTGAPVPTFAFTQSTNNQATALAVTNSTVYVGGKFSRVNGQLFTGLAAVNAATGAVDTGFDNQISGGIGVNGALTVQQLKLTHDESKLLVIHTGRKVDGQDRLGMAMIDTASKELLPWRSLLWDENLARVGGVTRIYAADISPDDSYFVVTSGSGGDAPPISDTAIAYPVEGGDDVQPLWISRAFDSIYSVAITEVAVYIGGHFGFLESPTAAVPWPGLDNVGYGTGQGLSGYGLGDQVVRRDHIGALDPATGTAVEWSPGSNSFEGNKAMEATPRGLFVGGDGMFQGGVRTGRVAFYDFQSLPAAALPETTIVEPIEGRVVTSGQPFTITGQATVSAAQGGISRVQVEVKDRDRNQFLRPDGTWASGTYAFRATLGQGTTSRSWSLPMTVVGNRNLEILARTFTTGGAGDTTKAVKRIESFSFDDTTPTTSINGPSGTLTSTTFTMTGTAVDDEGVSSLSFWFRDEQNRYLQNDGTVDAVFNSFRGTPDVVGATSATWSYEVTLPHEGVWRGSATATDTAGQADLRSAVRDWRIDSDAAAPTVTLNQPVAMTPPFAVPSLVVAPGSPLTFSGTAADNEQLKNVEISLRNTTTRENLGADGTWGVGVSSGQHRISPVNIGAASYNWSWTTPFALSPGSYSFTVRATDNDDLTTGSTNQGRLTVLAQVPGDAPPNGLVDVGGTLTVLEPGLALTGTATDDLGVQSVELTVLDNDTGRYMQDNGTMLAAYNRVDATLAAPGATSTSWSLPLVLPTAGDYSVTAFAYDTAGQQDASTTGATARYRYYPGDLAPVFNANLGQPIDGTAFDQGKIVVTGRAEDDISIARVEVAVMNSLGQYMSSSGSFTSTSASWRGAFLNSPGSPASNYSYTTPVIPDGTYTVLVRATDHHDQVSEPRTSAGVTVTRPPNEVPVASATVSCNVNVCAFDGRGSTDENATTLVYLWSFGTGQGTASGPVPTRTYNAPGTFTATLTVRDEWNVSSAPVSLTVVVAEPAGNLPPAPAFATSCTALVCATSSAGTADPNAGDTVTNLWSWGDGTPDSTGSAPSHTYAGPGTYTVRLTSTDGWGRSASTTRQLVLTEPAGNRAPTVAFTVGCTGLVCTTSSTGTSDPDGDQLRYSWTFGNGATSTQASPSTTYAAAGTYPVTLTVTDGWNRSSTLTRQVTVAP